MNQFITLGVPKRARVPLIICLRPIEGSLNPLPGVNLSFENIKRAVVFIVGWRLVVFLVESNSDRSA
jgi:hypothetical protein